MSDKEIEEFIKFLKSISKIKFKDDSLFKESIMNIILEFKKNKELLKKIKPVLKKFTDNYKNNIFFKKMNGDDLLKNLLSKTEFIDINDDKDSLSAPIIDFKFKFPEKIEKNNVLKYELKKIGDILAVYLFTTVNIDKEDFYIDKEKIIIKTKKFIGSQGLNKTIKIPVKIYEKPLYFEKNFGRIKIVFKVI